MLVECSSNSNKYVEKLYEFQNVPVHPVNPVTPVEPVEPVPGVIVKLFLSILFNKV